MEREVEERGKQIHTHAHTHTHCTHPLHTHYTHAHTHAHTRTHAHTSHTINKPESRFLCTSLSPTFERPPNDDLRGCGAPRPPTKSKKHLGSIKRCAAGGVKNSDFVLPLFERGRSCEKPRSQIWYLHVVRKEPAAYNAFPSPPAATIDPSTSIVSFRICHARHAEKP